jgi:hypothetical protein
MAEVEMSIEWDDEALKELVTVGVTAINRAQELTAMDIWANVQIEAPKDTGRLAGSWDVRESNGWVIFTNVEYASIVHDGRGEVVPVAARALHFFIQGAEVFAMYSSPVDPNPYADRAIERTEARVNDFIQIALQEAGLT